MHEIVQTFLRTGWIRTHKPMILLLSVCWLLLSFPDPNNTWGHTSVPKISTTDVTGHVSMHRQHGLFQHPHKHQSVHNTPEHRQPRILSLLCLTWFETNQWNMHILHFSWLTKPPQFMGFKSDIHAWALGCLANHCLRPWVLVSGLVASYTWSSPTWQSLANHPPTHITWREDNKNTQKNYCTNFSFHLTSGLALLWSESSIGQGVISFTYTSKPYIKLQEYQVTVTLKFWAISQMREVQWWLVL